MTDFGTPTRSELPSVRQLNKATAFAAATAAILLVTIILPAEYGIDPTGIGSALGLKAMGVAKQTEQNAENEAPAADTLASTDNASVAGEAPAANQNGKVTLTLQPGEGREVKATMKAGEEFEFTWATDKNAVNYDQHGEVFGAASDEYTSYDKGTKASSTGKFRAPFDGTHGWYWRNRTEGPVTITVSATGQFSKFELKE
ncbi:hypothetical protein [Parasphingorhabdus sp.]|jgi:hypothetical protein|uniref:hypothetical protein n=1 Tax=Parasphingorhabdus sp. TaxID=2709688 RepID=UPI0039E4B50D